MVKYLLRRLVWGIITLFIFQAVIFFLANVLIPGDWVTQFSFFLAPEQRQEMREQLGLNLPLWQQYLNWLRSFVDGGLGRSMSGAPVWDILKGVMPATLMVFVPGTLVSFSLGVWLGKVTAWRRGPVSSLTTLGSIVLYTSFPAWLAFLAVYFLGRRLQLYRALLIPMQSTTLWRTAPWPPSKVMWDLLLGMAAIGLLVFAIRAGIRRWSRVLVPSLVATMVLLAAWVASWYLFGFSAYALDTVSHFALPFLTYVLISFGETMLIMRTNMTDTLKEEYITTARAKGVPERVVRDRHAARNAWLPVLSRFVISLPYLLTGLVIIEHSFSFSDRIVGLRGIQPGAITFQGMGWAFYTALYLQDLPLVMGALFIVGVLAVVARIILDTLHALLDPRIRYQGEI